MQLPSFTRSGHTFSQPTNQHAYPSNWRQKEERTFSRLRVVSQYQQVVLIFIAVKILNSYSILLLLLELFYLQNPLTLSLLPSVYEAVVLS
jgi:hypothetical protein